MPDLNFHVSGVEPVECGMVPLLHFKLNIETAAPQALVQALLLQVQIQIQSPQRSYTAVEKERLVELFGTPERWGQTLRNRLWTHAHVNTGAFQGRAELTLPVLCTYDLNLAATKYFYALEEGDVSLLFLFSGSVFYPAADGRLQVERIPWNKECVYRMPVSAWAGLMESHYPNSAWLYLRRDVFDRLYTFKRQRGLSSWEEALEQLLRSAECEAREVAV
jgi:hypothetical protein